MMVVVVGLEMDLVAVQSRGTETANREDNIFDQAMVLSCTEMSTRGF